MLSKLAVLTFAAAVVAAPAVDEPIKIAFASRPSLTKRNGEIDTIAFLQSLNRTLHKYNSKVHVPSIDHLFGGRLAARNNLALTDQVSSGEDELYYGPIQIGTTNPQTFTIDFDTGSADLFVPGPSCGTSQGCVGTTKYNQGGQDEKNTTSVTYGSGSISGENYLDTVSVAGLSASRTNVISLTTASGFSSSAAQGLMGMAFSTIAQSKQPTYFENLIAQGKVATKAFSFYLGRAASNTQAASELTLGGTDPSKYTGSFTTVPVTTKGYWQVAVDGVNVNGKNAGASTKGQAAIDTGTTLILAPTAAAFGIFANIPGAIPLPLLSGSLTVTLFGYPCSSTAQVAFVFAGKSFAVNSLDLNFGQLTSLFSLAFPNKQLSRALEKRASGGYCIAGIAAADIDPTQNLYVVGDTFLKNWYTSFNYNLPSVQFAALH